MCPKINQHLRKIYISANFQTETVVLNEF